MPELVITVQLELDGVAIPNFPVVERLVVTDAATFNSLQFAPGGAASLVPASAENPLQVLVLTTDTQVSVGINSGAPPPFPVFTMEANSLLVLFNTTVASTPTGSIQITNGTTGNATISGAVGGT